MLNVNTPFYFAIAMFPKKIPILIVLVQTLSCLRSTSGGFYLSKDIPQQSWYKMPLIPYFDPYEYYVYPYLPVTPSYEENGRMDTGGVPYEANSELFFRTLTKHAISEKQPEPIEQKEIGLNRNSQEPQSGVDITSSIDERPRIIIKTVSPLSSLFNFSLRTYVKSKTYLVPSFG